MKLLEQAAKINAKSYDFVDHNIAYNGHDIEESFSDGFIEGAKWQSKWINFENESPPIGTEVLAYNPEWIDEDFNPKGVRIGYLSDEGFISAHWWDYQDCYTTISNSECDNNPAYSEKIKKNINPKLWLSIDRLTDLIP